MEKLERGQKVMFSHDHLITVDPYNNAIIIGKLFLYGKLYLGPNDKELIIHYMYVDYFREKYLFVSFISNSSLVVILTVKALITFITTTY